MNPVTRIEVFLFLIILVLMPLGGSFKEMLIGPVQSSRIDPGVLVVARLAVVLLSVVAISVAIWGRKNR